MSAIQKVALVFTLIGALNWGLIGLFSFDLVEFLFGTMTFLSRTLYSLYGIAAIINIGLLSLPTD